MREFCEVIELRGILIAMVVTQIYVCVKSHRIVHARIYALTAKSILLSANLINKI